MTSILIVEDDALVALLVEENLVQSGFQVWLAATPAEALLLAAWHKPDVALLDVRLSGELNGIELAEKLDAQQSVAIIYVTANPGEVKRRATVGVGCLAKPFANDWLVAAIRIVMEAGNGAVETGDLPPGFTFLARRGDPAEQLGTEST